MTGLAVRHIAPRRPLRTLRLALALLILIAALAGADIILHSYRVVFDCSPPHLLVKCFYFRSPGWVHPVAVAVSLLGIVGAGAVLMARRRSEPE
jgi:hypothetical protein